MATATCGHCGRKSPDAFLCADCATELRDMLVGLPMWLNYLHDAAVGQTRLGESERRSSDQSTPMPVNISASELYSQVSMTLFRILQDICESRGVTVP